MILNVIPELISITATYGRNIVVGDKIQSDKIEITATYSDGSTETIEEDSEEVTYWIGNRPIENLADLEFDEVGQHEVKIRYNGQEAVMTLTVADDATTPSASASATATPTATAETSNSDLSVVAIESIACAVILLILIVLLIYFDHVDKKQK